MIRETVDHPNWSVRKHTRSPTPYSFEIGALFLKIALLTLEDMSALTNAFLAFSRILAICPNSKVGSSAAVSAPKSAQFSSSIMDPASLGSFPNTHWLGANPFTLDMLFLVITDWVSTCWTASLPTSCSSAMTRITIAFSNPPCLSVRPICSGLSTPIWVIWQPIDDSSFENSPLLCNPLSDTTSLGGPAQLIQLLWNAFKHSLEVAWHPPTLTTVAWWKHVPWSTIENTEYRSPFASFTSKMSTPTASLKLRDLGRVTFWVCGFGCTESQPSHRSVRAALM